MHSSRKPLVVVGSANMDLVTRVLSFPRPGQTVAGQALQQFPGGKGANQAVAAAKTGIRVSFVGNIGQGVFGNALLANLREKGIDVRHVVRSQDLPAGTALILLNQEGENQIVVTRSSNDLVNPTQIRRARSLIKRAGLLLLQLEIPAASVSAAIDLASSLAVPVMLNPAPANGPLPRALLAKVAWLTPNESELAALSRLPAKSTRQIEAAGRRLLRSGVQNVVVTCGARGACWLSSEKQQWFPAKRVKVVDTVGAGDSFSGTLAARLCCGHPPDRAIRLAVDAATRNVQFQGAQA